MRALLLTLAAMLPIEFLRNTFARSEFVGWPYCGLLDATQQIARK